MKWLSGYCRIAALSRSSWEPSAHLQKINRSVDHHYNPRSDAWLHDFLKRSRDDTIFNLHGHLFCFRFDSVDRERLLSYSGKQNAIYRAECGLLITIAMHFSTETCQYSV